MLAISTDGPLAVILIVVAMAAGATIGVAAMAFLAAEAVRFTYSLMGDRDSELMNAGDRQ